MKRVCFVFITNCFFESKSNKKFSYCREFVAVHMVKHTLLQTNEGPERTVRSLCTT